MPAINYATREINLRVVYYGPGLGGKTSNLRALHERVHARARGRLIELMTESDRTLFFDFMPLSLGSIRGFSTRFHLYTVPGQIHYRASRALILKIVDVVVFVADSQAMRREANIESLSDLDVNLREHGYSPDDVPLVLQYNKRDCAEAMSRTQLDADLNHRSAAVYEAIATRGIGVVETFEAAARLAVRELRTGRHAAR